MFYLLILWGDLIFVWCCEWEGVWWDLLKSLWISISIIYYLSLSRVDTVIDTKKYYVSSQVEVQYTNNHKKVCLVSSFAKYLANYGDIHHSWLGI